MSPRLAQFFLDPEDQAYQHDLAWDLVRDLYERSRPGLLGLSIFLFLLSRLLDRALDHDPHLRNLFFALVLLILLRLGTAMAYAWLCRRMPDPHLRHMLFCGGTLVTGCLLGAITLRALHVLTPLEVALYCSCHVGITTLALVSMASSFMAYALYLAPNVTILALGLYIHNLPGIPDVFLVFIISFGLVALLMAHQVHGTTKRQGLVALRLRDAALRDGLTGLHNRRFVDEFMGTTASLIRREWASDDAPGRSLGLYILDLDHFKQVNDTHGHAAGDAVLTQVAMLLGLVSRRPDLVARWGGEEFLVVAQDVERDVPGALAERIRMEVEAFEFLLPNGKTLQTTCSIGCAPFPFSPLDPDALTWEGVLNLADVALYRAKTSGRNQVRTVLPGPEAQGQALRDLGASDKEISLGSDERLLVIR